jgi:hypothetical protein
MSDEPRPEPKGPTSPLLHHQAGVMAAMLDAMHKEDKQMVLDFLGLAQVEEVPEGRKLGESASKKKQ